MTSSKSEQQSSHMASPPGVSGKLERNSSSTADVKLLQLTEQIEETTETVWESLTSCRWTLSYVGCICVTMSNALKVNLALAMVCMVKPHSLLEEQSIKTSCGSADSMNETANSSMNDVVSDPNQIGGEIEWSKSMQGMLLSSLFYGYIVTQIPAGYLAGRFGGKIVILAGMLTHGVATLLVPVAARFDRVDYTTSAYLVMTLRIIMGLSSAVVLPAFHSLWSKWAPPLERSKLITVCNSGVMVGQMLMLAVGGFFCEWLSFDGGWPSIFYTGGGLYILFCPVWFFTVYNSPTEHPRISEKEKNYIMNSLEQKHYNQSIPVPWRSIFTSMPMWAIIVAHTCTNFGAYTLMTKLPAFMDEVLNFGIKQNGLFSALPYISMIILANLAAQVVDKLRTQKILRTVTCRKICMTIAFVVPAVSIICIGYLPCDSQVLGVILITIGCGFQGFERAGWSVNHVDIAPKYAGLLLGITNTFATVPGMVAPSLVNALTVSGIVEEWRRVFFVWAGVYAFGAIFYAVFSSGSVQEWAKDPEENSDNYSESKKLAAKKEPYSTI